MKTEEELFRRPLAEHTREAWTQEAAIQKGEDFDNPSITVVLMNRIIDTAIMVFQRTSEKIKHR